MAAFAAVLGGLTGASKQIAQLGATVVAYLLARPIGHLIAPSVARSLHSPEVIGLVAGTFAAFIGVLVVLRFILTRVLRRLLVGRDNRNPGLDRWLGFALGGLKVLAIAYVAASALVFAEENVVVAGRRFGLSPKSSVTFAIARNYNLFNYFEFGAVRDLVAVAKASTDPERARKLQNDPAFVALKKDPRFRQALSEQGVRRAIDNDDYQALLKSNPVLRLVEDATAAGRLRQAAEIADERE